MMQGTPRELSEIEALRSSYSKDIGSVNSSVPSLDPGEGSIFDFCKPMSVWAETAEFEPQTPRG